MAERRIVVPVVAGSSPVIHPTKLKPHLEESRVRFFVLGCLHVGFDASRVAQGHRP